MHQTNRGSAGKNSPPQRRPPQPPPTAAENKAFLEQLLAYYLESRPAIKDVHKEGEVEVRFGTRGKSLTKIDYNNVIQKLLAEGFYVDTNSGGGADGEHYLRIYSEYVNPATGRTLMSDNIRTEIKDLYLIQEYCRSNSLQKLLNMPQQINHRKIKFTQKKPVRTESGDLIRDVVFSDFNYSISYKTEQDFSTTSEVGKNIIRYWEENKKTFRFINRVRFQHRVFPIFVDVSIIKTSKMTATTKRMIPTMTIDDAGVFTNQERYEIELELDNRKIHVNSKIADLLDPLRKCIRVVLSGLQRSNHPIPVSRQRGVIQDYMKMIHGDKYEGTRVFSKHFIGPSTYTLQMSNVVPSIETADTTTEPNIRKHYTVTDKADGERKMIFIDKSGAIYFIDINMEVTFTGAYTKSGEITNTLIDGEHILHDKYGRFINLYAAFDIYFFHDRDVRTFPFVFDEEDASAAADAAAIVDGGVTVQDVRTHKAPRQGTDTEKEFKEKCRLDLLRRTINSIRAQSSPATAAAAGAEEASPCDITFECKDFYWGDNIFTHCNTILSKVIDGTYRYKTDGLIFTPAALPVGGVPGNMQPANEKRAWKYSLKWKKPEDNTIDFLVTAKKDAKNDAVDEIFHIYENGENYGATAGTAATTNIQQYKVLELRCGFDPAKHGYVDPWNSLIEGEFGSRGDETKETPEGIHPAIFKPTDPSIKNAHLCNIKLVGDDGIMKTEDGEIIEDHMIVEFSYDMSDGAHDGRGGGDPNRGPEWRWIPKRVRYDKTSEYRAGGKNYGNAYHVANSNWYTIHHPITETMISTGEGIPTVISDDVYYNNSSLGENVTRPKRDFHNLYVKRKLLGSVAQPKDTLIDYAVGKGGDIPKWAEARLSFVFGVDLYADNIQNKFDGACARYLTKRKTAPKNLFRAMFVRGNSSLNIRSTDAMVTEKEKQVTRAVFGRGEKDAGKLGRGLYDVYGAGAGGFQISSCQFALHYFFESEKTLHNFLRNVAECTKVGGFFIGTCYDGEEIFKLLRGKMENESVTFFSAPTGASGGGGKKICEITKRYSYTGFSDDYHSVGYKIDVYQDNINQTISEYLVNFPYLVKMMELYGFELDRQNQDITEGTQLFKSMFQKMQEECRTDRFKQNTYSSALTMTAAEKQDSFLNRCFVFRKVHDVNAEKIMAAIMRERNVQDELEMEYLMENGPSSLKKTEKEIVTAAKLAESRKISPVAAPAAAPALRKRAKKVVIMDVASLAPAPVTAPAAPAPAPTPAPKSKGKKKIVLMATEPAAEPAPTPSAMEVAAPVVAPIVKSKSKKKVVLATAAEEAPPKKDKCKPDEELNPKTGRCIKKCKEGTKRNEETGRCVKTK